MRAAAISASQWVVAEEAAVQKLERVAQQRIFSVVEGWNPEKFAQEQIRSLVRRLFSPSSKPPVRQVVFSAVESDTDVRGICTHVVASLAIETAGNVLLVGGSIGQVAGAEIPSTNPGAEKTQRSFLQERSIQVCRNLWIAPSKPPADNTLGLHSYLSEIRREFEYSVIAGPSAAEFNESTAMAQFADGIVLVLSAGRTRRAAACRIKKSLDDAQVRLLGVVLSDREFPIPDRIYRRL